MSRLAPAAALLLAIGCGGAGEGGEPAAARPEDAPGRSIVFERERDGNTDLWLIPAAGGEERRLTRHPALDILPRWTPDGDAVIFSSRRDGRWQLYRVGLDGSEPQPVQANGHSEWQADPGPGDAGLAFLSDRAGAQALFVDAGRDGDPRLLVQHGDGVDLGNPHWSADGSRLVFSSNRGLGGHRIYLFDLASGEERRLSPLQSGGCEPRFGPGGGTVAYVRREHLTRDRSWIVEHELATGSERERVAWPALNYDPVYSPEGDEIAFASTIAGDYAVYRMRLSDGRSWRVTFGPGAARHPDYRPVRDP